MRAALFLALATGFTLLSSAAADDKKDKEKAEKVTEALKQLAGRWAVESARAEGEDIDDEKGAVIQFEGDKLTFFEKDGKTKKDDFTVKVYPSETPKGIDFIRTTDKYVFRFIYEVKGDTLKLCIWKAEPARRAKEFTGEDEHALAILKRPKS